MYEAFSWSFKKAQLEKMLKGLSFEDERILKLSAIEQFSLIKEGKLSSLQLVKASLQAMLRLEGHFNAMISISEDAIEQARLCDLKRKEDENFLGLPMVIKDNINTQNLPTTFGAKALCSTRPEKNAALVQTLLDAGCVLLGKSSLSEFASSGMSANSLTGQVLNPYNEKRTPGGSSGGSAVAVALEYASFAIGTDGVNSVRSPASACSLYGLRPTKGSIDRTGMGLSSNHQDMPGILTRSAEDSRLVLSILLKKSFSDFRRVSLNKKRLALLKNNCGTDEEVLSIVNKTVSDLKNLGFEILILNDDVLDTERMLLENNVIRFEQKENSDAYFANPKNHAAVSSLKEYLSSGLVQPEVAKTLESEFTPRWSKENPAYKKALSKNENDLLYVKKLMQDKKIDAFLYPMQKIPAVPIAFEKGQMGRNGIMASCLGLPALCFPGGYTKENIPVGMELMGRKNEENFLLDIANALNAAFPVRKKPEILR